MIYEHGNQRASYLSFMIFPIEAILTFPIQILDVRAAEDHGSDPSLIDQSFDTEKPLNINDSDLDPNSTEFPIPRQGASEMTFCLIRYEICSLVKRLSYTPPGKGPCNTAAMSWTLEDKEKLIKETAERMEEKYLKYCENAGPLCWVAATVARLITAKMGLIIYHPLIHPSSPESLNQDVRDRLFMASIEIIEYTRVLEIEASTKQWVRKTSRYIYPTNSLQGWLFQTYIQWHAIAYILIELSVRSQSMIVDRAWKVIDGVFTDWGDSVEKTKKGMIWQTMKKLMARARRKREENMANTNHQTAQTLGMDFKNVRPPPVGLSGNLAPPGIAEGIAQERVRSLNSPAALNKASQPEPCFLDINCNNDEMFPPQIIGVGPNYRPEQIQLQLQQQQQQQQQQTPWLMDDNALLDLDMQGLEGDESWEGWDDMVKDFKIGETDVQIGEIRGPILGVSLPFRFDSQVVFS
jgi:hypothetical protein